MTWAMTKKDVDAVADTIMKNFGESVRDAIWDVARRDKGVRHEVHTFNGPNATMHYTVSIVGFTAHPEDRENGLPEGVNPS